MLNLGPVDGYDSIALAASYTNGQVEVTAAIRYFDARRYPDPDRPGQPRQPASMATTPSGSDIRVGYSF
jgi:hypothetical protein